MINRFYIFVLGATLFFNGYIFSTDRTDLPTDDQAPVTPRDIKYINLDVHASADDIFSVVVNPRGFSKLVKYLDKKYLDSSRSMYLAWPRNADVTSLLHHAAKAGLLDHVILLVMYGIDVNAIDHEGKTASQILEEGFMVKFFLDTITFNPDRSFWDNALEKFPNFCDVIINMRLRVLWPKY